MQDPELSRLDAALKELRDAAKSRAVELKRRQKKTQSPRLAKLVSESPRSRTEAQVIAASKFGVWRRISTAFSSFSHAMFGRDADR